MLNPSIKQTIKSGLPRPIAETLYWLRQRWQRPPNYKVYVSYVDQKAGLEIGGPSTLFKMTLPIYQKVKNLDGVNFSTNTIWEGDIHCGSNYNYFGNRRGTQYISDAIDLSQINENSYDFVLSSNCLEHIANPLKALVEWRRVIKPNGSLILVLPNKISNFDHQRSTTTFDHILKDFDNNTSEYDLTHLEEILELHDLYMDPPAGNLADFKRRSLDNINNRALHHHVFNLNVMKSMLNYAGYEVIETTETYNNFFALATKTLRNSASPMGEN